MYITLTDITKPIPLQEYIDNTDSKREIGLKSLTYWVGWYNILQDETYEWSAVSAPPTVRAKPTVVAIPAGLYSFDRLSSLLSNAALSLSVNKSNGKCTFTVAPRHEVNIPENILKLLGFDIYPPKWDSGTYTSTNPVDFATKSVYIYLHQVSSSHNLLDGNISNIICSVPISKTTFGESDTISFQCPEYRKLQSGIIDELGIEVRDNSNNLLNNHGLPIIIVFEIR